MALYKCRDTCNYITIIHSTLLLILFTFKDVSDGRAPWSLLGGGTVHLHLFHVDVNVMRTDALFRKKKLRFETNSCGYKERHNILKYENFMQIHSWNLFDVALTYLNVDSGSLAPEGAVRGAGSSWRVTASLRAQVP